MKPLGHNSQNWPFLNFKDPSIEVIVEIARNIWIYFAIRFKAKCFTTWYSLYDVFKWIIFLIEFIDDSVDKEFQVFANIELIHRIENNSGVSNNVWLESWGIIKLLKLQCEFFSNDALTFFKLEFKFIQQFHEPEFKLIFEVDGWLKPCFFQQIA